MRLMDCLRRRGGERKGSNRDERKRMERAVKLLLFQEKL